MQIFKRNSPIIQLKQLDINKMATSSWERSRPVRAFIDQLIDNIGIIKE